MAICGKNGKRNLDAEGSVINGVFGMIPAALIGGPVGAIASFVVGIIGYNKKIKEEEYREWYKNGGSKIEFEEKQRKEFEPKDKWDTMKENDIRDLIHNKYFTDEYKIPSVFFREKSPKKFIDVSELKITYRYLDYHKMKDGDVYDEPLFNFYTNEKVGDIVYITYRDFCRRFENRMDSIKMILIYKGKSNKYGGQELNTISPDRCYFIDGKYYKPVGECATIRNNREKYMN